MVVGCTLCVKAIQQNKTSQVMLQGQAAPNCKWLKTARDYFSLMLPVWWVSWELTPSGYQVTKRNLLTE